MKTRHAIRLIERIGGVLLRQKGSHRIYRLPGGGTFCIPFSGSHRELSTGLRQRLLRVLNCHALGKGKEVKKRPP